MLRLLVCSTKVLYPALCTMRSRSSPAADYKISAPSTGFVIDNHTVTPKNPNMLFNVERDSQGGLTFMHFYACLGKLPPVVGKETFSYLLYARNPHIDSNQIEDKVRVDARYHAFELDGHVDTNATTWHTCGVL